jgi:hypothetical protein
MKSNYERHVVQAHPKGQCYPSKMELARLGIELGNMTRYKKNNDMLRG